MKVLNHICGAAALAGLGLAAPANVQSAAPTPGVVGNPSAAVFDGSLIDLSNGWGDAHACVESGTSTRCYRTEAELLRNEPGLGPMTASISDGANLLTSTCPSSLRLYRSSGYTGSVLYLSTQGVVINLSTYSFDNDTSSYVVGACSASFFSGSNAGGSVYPGSTSAGSQSGSMSAGWDNVISSVYIS